LTKHSLHYLDMRVVIATIRVISKWLQRAVAADDDGKIGPATLAAVKAKDPYQVKAAMLSERLVFMTALPNWSAFSKGWARRIASLLK